MERAMAPPYPTVSPPLQAYRIVSPPRHPPLRETYKIQTGALITCMIFLSLGIIVLMYFIGLNFYYIAMEPSNPTIVYIDFPLKLWMFFNLLIVLISSLSSTYTLYLRWKTYIIISVYISCPIILFYLTETVLFQIGGILTPISRHNIVTTILQSVLISIQMGAEISFYFIYKEEGDFRYAPVIPIPQEYLYPKGKYGEPVPQMIYVVSK